jgi:hypothetical protein
MFELLYDIKYTKKSCHISCLITKIRTIMPIEQKKRISLCSKKLRKRHYFIQDKNTNLYGIKCNSFKSANNCEYRINYQI